MASGNTFIVQNRGLWFGGEEFLELEPLKLNIHFTLSLWTFAFNVQPVFAIEDLLKISFTDDSEVQLFIYKKDFLSPF